MPVEVDILEDSIFRLSPELLNILLKDHTTSKKDIQRNIFWATSDYEYLGEGYQYDSPILPCLITGDNGHVIMPRILKSRDTQTARSREMAEVFTPSWICNAQNNLIDEAWFGRKNVFNTELEHGWKVNTDTVVFDETDGWKKYVDSRRLEIACGEAPYIVSRYDATTGELIEVKRRIGILDRKLRVVNENTANEKDWFKWVLRAYQSVYGYEFQGDNLLIARINLLITFVDYMQDRWNRVPTDTELKKIVNVIVWNLWQMDGITGRSPFQKSKEEYQQFSLFDFVVADDAETQSEDELSEMYCRIYDWRSDRSLTYKSMKEGK